MTRLFTTDNSLAPFLARLTLGAVILPHGLQKTLGWFGGYGIEGTMGFLTGQMGLPGVVAALVIFAESAGAALLIAGAFTRINAALVASVMIGAVATMHASNGFFMNWYGAGAGEGFEYHLLALGLAAIAIVHGGGRWSVDGVLARATDDHASAAVPVPGK